MAGTRCINGRELRRLYEAKGARWTVEHLTEALEKGHLKGSDFSIRELAENTVKNGPEWVRSMEPRKGGYHLLEAGSVDYSAFSNITGQIFFNEIKQKYEGEEFVFSKLVPTKSSNLLDEEKIPGFGGIGNQFDTPIKEGDAYPNVTISEDYITLPPKRKRGGIIAVTKEAIAGDRTGQLLEYCNELGWYLGYRKEVSIIDTLIDGNGAAASIRNGGTRYHWKDTSYAAYQSSTPWVNLKSSGGSLNDWTSVQTLELLFSAMTNPFTGLPIMVEPTHIIVPPDLRHTAQRIMTATNVQTHVGGYATSGNLQDYHAPTPLDPYKVVSSRVFKKRMNTAGQTETSTWYMGNPARAICYRDNWGITLEQMGQGSEEAFNRDIVHRIRVSERGTAGWLEPRLMAKSVA